MKISQECSNSTRSAELAAAVQFLTHALRMASGNYRSGPPDHGRAAIRIALVGVIKLISDIYPNEPSLPLPLNKLLYGLADLDRGKVVPLLKPTKVSNNPGNSLLDDLFRAFPAGAMTRLVGDRVMSRNEASRYVAKQLSKMGYKHSSGTSITPSQVAKWREKMMTERAAEDLGVARYDHALQLVSGMQPVEAAKFLLESMPDLFPPNFPKKPPA